MPSCGIRSYHCHPPNSRKSRSDNKMAVPEASVHPVRNRLCYHFTLHQTMESCSKIDIRRIMLLRSVNKFSCVLQLQMSSRMNGHFMHGSARNTNTTASAVSFSANLSYV